MRRRARWLALCLLTIAAAVVAYAAMVWTSPGQRIDGQLATLILDLTPPVVGRALAALSRPYVLVGLGLAVAALLPWAVIRGCWADAGAALIIPATAIPAAYALRTAVLTRPDLISGGYLVNTYPSTHAAAAFSLLASALILWPKPLEVGDLTRAGFLAVVVGLGNVTSYAHRPADVLGSVLLAAGATALALATTGIRPGRPTPRRDLPRSAPR